MPVVLDRSHRQRLRRGKRFTIRNLLPRLVGRRRFSILTDDFNQRYQSAPFRAAFSWRYLNPSKLTAYNLAPRLQSAPFSPRDLSNPTDFDACTSPAGRNGRSAFSAGSDNSCRSNQRKANGRARRTGRFDHDAANGESPHSAAFRADGNWFIFGRREQNHEIENRDHFRRACRARLAIDGQPTGPGISADSDLGSGPRGSWHADGPCGRRP